MPIGAAIGGSAVLGAGAGIYSANKASSAQTKSAALANQTQQGMFDQTQKNLSPFIQAGQGAIGSVNDLLGYGTSGQAGIQDRLQSLPGYQFLLNQGLQATQNGYAAKGLGSSGAALKGAADYAQGQAGTYWDKLLGNLMTQEGMGASAAGGLGNFATQTGMGIGQNLIGAGNAQAGAAIGSGNALTGAVGNGTNSYLQYNMLQQLLGQGQGGLSASYNGQDWNPGPQGFPWAP